MKKYFVLETLDDIIIGSSNAAAFSAQTLDYIPGSAVMGAVCSLYGKKDLAADTLNLFFQENMTVFSDFLPLTSDGEETLPAPMSIHYVKKTQAPFFNFLNKEVKDEEKQYKQVRGDNRTGRFAKFSPDKTVTARTAIDYATNTAKTSALYNRDAIASGQRFLGYCDIPDTLEKGKRPANENRTEDKIAKARAEVFDVLQDGRILRIGAGRGSEYGRVLVHDVTAAMEKLNKTRNEKLPDPGMPENGKRKLVLWCLSNAEFLDAVTSYDSPIPDNPAMLWALARENIVPCFLPGESFVRTGKTRYYNNARGGLDSARVFVARGSVLVYEYEYSGDEERLKTILGNLQNEGCGLSRQLGFGRVMVNPDWISQGELKDDVPLFESGFKFAPEGSSLHAADSSQDPDKDPEVQWLKEMAAGRVLSLGIDDMAADLLKKILDIYSSARTYLGIKNDTDFGPGKTQWQSLRSALCSLSSLDRTKEAILEKIKEVTIGGKEENRAGKEMQEDDIWNIKFLYDGRSAQQAQQTAVVERSFEECFRALVEDKIGAEGSTPELVLNALIRCLDLNFTLHDPRIKTDLDILLKNSGPKQKSGNKKEEKRK